jgi:hypothetical protein
VVGSVKWERHTKFLPAKSRPRSWADCRQWQVREGVHTVSFSKDVCSKLWTQVGNLETLVIDEGHVISFRGEQIWIRFKQDRQFSLLPSRCHFISLVMLHHRSFPPFQDRLISPPTVYVSLLLPSKSLPHFILTKFLSITYNTFSADPVYYRMFHLKPVRLHGEIKIGFCSFSFW